MKKNYSTWIAFIVLMILLGACSKKDKVDYSNSGLAGKWKSKNIQGSIKEKSTGDEKIQDFADIAEGAVININADGTYTVSSDGDLSTDKYSISGNQVSFHNYYFEGFDFTGTFSVNGNSMQLVQSPDAFIKLVIAIVKDDNPDSDITAEQVKELYTITDITYSFEKQ